MSSSSTSVDQPSATMWWTTITSRCSSAPSGTSTGRNRGPATRSRPAVSSATTRRTTSSGSPPGSGGAWLSRNASAGTSARTGVPSRSGKHDRRESCRRTTASTAQPSASVSRAPARWRARVMAYSAGVSEICASSHIRCWAADSSPSAVPRAPLSGASSSVTRSASASWAGVWCSKTARTPIAVSRAERSLATSRVACRELPPLSKKFSCGATGVPPRTSAVASRTARRTGSVCSGAGGTAARSCRAAMSASAFRSILPLGDRGSVSSATSREGTSAAGSRCARNPRSSSASASAPVKNPVRVAPAPAPAGTAAARETCGWAVIAASISPGSIRRPCSFTWWSIRPSSRSSPLPSTRPRSPVRYSRLPGGPYGSGRKRCAVRAARPW